MTLLSVVFQIKHLLRVPYSLLSISGSSMCGQVNKKMSVQETVEDLTQECIQLRRNLLAISDRKEREKIVLNHIKERARADIRVSDFQKGLEWFNVSKGLSMTADLAGKIIILDFFTYCCINCMHILPDLDALEKKYPPEDGLVVVGVHSAKFSNERNSKKILSAVQRYNINHPVVNDAKLSMWRDIGIVCWPSLVILGPKGQPLFVLVGEGHREEMFTYVGVALAYFNSLKEISDHEIPLKPAQHLLPLSKDVILFPGKVQTFESQNNERVIVSDTGNNRILVMKPDGTVEHVIGGYAPDFKDGNFKDARFNGPQGVCVLSDIVFVADNENHAIRKIDLEKKVVSTIAGTGSQAQDYVGGKIGTEQALSSPWDVAIYHYKQDDREVPVLLIAIAGTHQIWAFFLEDTVWWKKKVYKAGTCVAIVGNGREENRNNAYPHAASLAQPSGLAVAQEIKAVFFADSESSTVRRVHMEDGKVSAVAGADRNPANLHNYGDIDGHQYNAKLQHPLGLTWDKKEKVLYVADTYNHKIKKVTPEGNCTTVYGAGKPTENHVFDEPSGLAISSNGDVLFIADTNNHCIKAIDKRDDHTIRTLSIKLPKDTGRPADKTFNFENSLNKDGGELTISFDAIFEEDLKFTPEAPQKWSLVLPSDEWTTEKSSGSFTTPINVKIPKGEGVKELKIILDLVVCKTDECIPKKFAIIFAINQKSDAPTVVRESKKLEVK
ncbi:NHL repeat-containing protein 2 [Venturia canescens]|uniref:NHL repeat-containing protein 2 n=1 Tax=Venturia canescens TaxID=32260 RepID=UPI001C9C3847|nr:NHL repeat-containing protein 2 [Venturia canescens]